MSPQDTLTYLIAGTGPQRMQALQAATAAVLQVLQDRGDKLPLLWDSWHFRAGEDAKRGRGFVRQALLSSDAFSGTREQYIEILKGGLPSTPLKLARYTGCFCCGGSVQGWLTSRGLEVRDVDPCPFPSGILSEFRVSFPTGRVLVPTDPREIFPELGTAIPQEGLPVWVHHAEVSSTMAPLGLASGFSGPVQVGVYDLGRGLYGVGRGLYGRKLGVVASQAWWWGLTDASAVSPSEALRYSRFQVEPGTYHFSLDVSADPLGSYVELARFERVP